MLTAMMRNIVSHLYSYMRITMNAVMFDVHISLLAFKISLGPTYAHGHISGSEDICLNAEGTSPVSGMDISIRQWEGTRVLGGNYI